MEKTHPVLPFLSHAIIRQESCFDASALSGAGAQGLMQLMPATAKHVAQQMGVHYVPGKLSNPDFNITVGSRYLSNLVDNYNGSYILAIAAYNAGPGNVSKWLKEMGDPRLVDDVDVIVDWIEMIPFKETRNYVHRVMEALQVYRHSIHPELPAKNMLIEDLKR